jgi:hypothetical protein
MPYPFPVERRCDHCGNDWPKFTAHVCPPQEVEINEALVSVITDAMRECPVMLGHLDICDTVVALLARPLTRQLLILRDDLMNALEAG